MNKILPKSLSADAVLLNEIGVVRLSCIERITPILTRTPDSIPEEYVTACRDLLLELAFGTTDS